jgi:hypothetical protein
MATKKETDEEKAAREAAEAEAAKAAAEEAEANKHLPEFPLPTVNIPRPVVDGVVQWTEEEIHPEAEPEAEAVPNETGEPPAPSAEAAGTVSSK